MGQSVIDNSSKHNLGSRGDKNLIVYRFKEIRRGIGDRIDKKR